MDNDKNNQYSNNLTIRKSAAVMFIRLVMFEFLSGILYVLLRMGLRYLDIQLDTEFSLTPLALVKSLFFMIAEIGVAGFVILQWINNYYILTSNEIKYITGIISKREMNYSLENVQSVSFEQGLIGRILNYGSVKIFSPALQQELFLTEVPNPSKIVENIKEVLENDSGNRFIMQR